MQEEAVIETQLEFYRRGKAGCLFAAYAAVNPSKYGWRLLVSNVDKDRVEKLIQLAISLPEVSTQSIIFPSVITPEDLSNLLLVLKETPSMTLEQEAEFENSMCLGYRVNVGDLKSLVTGFGGFDFFPETRQAVFTEIVFRSKPRPDYEWVMKLAPHGMIHLADMDMKGMRENQFKALWYGSFDKTENILGHKADLRSAAKTTFAIPLNLWKGV